MLSRRSILTGTPTLMLPNTLTYSSTNAKKYVVTPMIKDLVNKQNGKCIVDAYKIIPRQIDVHELWKAIAFPDRGVLVQRNAKPYKYPLTPYAEELKELQCWINDLGRAVAKEDGAQDVDDKAYTSMHIRAQDGLGTGFGSSNKEVERWHIDGSYITMVMCLKGKGTDVAVQYDRVPADADRVIQDYITMEEGQALIMTGGQRELLGVRPTVHRAPMSNGQRLVIVAFFSL